MKYMVIGSFLLSMQMMSSMELEIILANKESSSPDYYSLTGLADYTIAGISSISGVINDNLTSVGNTMRMAASQAERFKKMGWPEKGTEDALKETLSIYKDVEKMRKKKAFTNEKAALLLRFDKRIVIINEFVASFVLNPQNTEGLLRARHTLKHHSPALAEYYKNMVVSYLEEKRDVLMSTSASLDQELKKFGVDAKDGSKGQDSGAKDDGKEKK